MTSSRVLTGLLTGIIAVGIAAPVLAQLVVLPAPRLLTTMPMGGQVGTSFPVTLTGESLDGRVELLFSDPHITAVPQNDANGELEPNTFLVTVSPETPPGIYEARVLTRLGISASRAFTVGTLPELSREKPNTTLETAMEIPLNSVCNAHTSAQGIDYYKFVCDQKTRVVVECAATGIDSKLRPVVIIADAQGRDLAFERRHGLLDLTVPQAGAYVVKIHGLTYEGGPESFYRLILQTLPESAPISRHPTTAKVNVISLPAAILHPAPSSEVEPNNRPNVAQKITLPCDVAGAFFPNADLDIYEFTAKKGEIWWVEVVSERFGLPTNPYVVVQQVGKKGETENVVDLAEFNNLPSPMKLSSNGNSYDGPHYDVGTLDAPGKLEINADGIYRLRIRDLFGGTRRDPRCVYRLIVRKPAPDFALASWAMHFELRSGDRNVLPKPIALRHGGTMAFEVVAVRKDGFDGPIEIGMEQLPAGLSAAGLTIPAGKNVGHLLITAAERGPAVVGTAKIVGRAEINGTAVMRESRLASMVWPIRDARNRLEQEIPNPRLMADVAVSITTEEAVPLTIAPASMDIITAQPDEKLTISLRLTWRGEFSGALKLKSIGAGFENVKPVDVPLNCPRLDLPVDLGLLKLPPGVHVFALTGPLIIKYRDNPAAVDAVAEALRLATEEGNALTAAWQLIAEAVDSAVENDKAASVQAVKEVADKLKLAQDQKTTFEKRLKEATEAAAPKEIVDIVVSEPIRIRVNLPENK